MADSAYRRSESHHLLTIIWGLGFSTLTGCATVNAQNHSIFQGGKADGYASAQYRSIAFSNHPVFAGGRSDGFAAAAFESVLHHHLFAGGRSDGFAASQLDSWSHNGIFRGGRADGFAGSGFEPIHHASIFGGGSGDGFATTGFEIIVHHSIFAGGAGDGAHVAHFESVSHHLVFAGGAGDGWSAHSFESRSHHPIFVGGSGDGFDSTQGSGALSPYSLYMLSSGVYGLNADPLLDLDSDSWNNLQEFAYGSHPGLPGSAPEFHSSLHNEGSDDELVLTYPRRAGGTEAGAHYLADGLSYLGQASLELNDWTASVRHRSPLSALPPLPPGYQYGALSTPALTDRAFLRIGTELLDPPE